MGLLSGASWESVVVPCIWELSGHYVCKNTVTQGTDFSVLVLNQGGREGGEKSCGKGGGRRFRGSRGSGEKEVAGRGRVAQGSKREERKRVCVGGYCSSKALPRVTNC